MRAGNAADDEAAAKNLSRHLRRQPVAQLHHDRLYDVGLITHVTQRDLSLAVAGPDESDAWLRHVAAAGGTGVGQG